MNEDVTANLEAQLHFGIEVKRFLEGNVGRFLVERAEHERLDAIEELKFADAENPKVIRELQNRIYRAESIQYWLAEAIQEAQQAGKVLSEGDTDG